jgi:hypothetical protein
MLASLLPSVLANIIASALAYALIRPYVASSAAALLAAMAIPAGWTLATVAWRRRAEPAGLLIIAAGLTILIWYRRRRRRKAREDMASLPAAVGSVQRRRADVPHVVGDVDRDSGGNDLVDAVKHVSGQLDPVRGEVAV